MASTTVFVVTSEEYYGVGGVECEKCGYVPFGIQVFRTKEAADLAITNHQAIEPCDDCQVCNDLDLIITTTILKG